MLVLVYVHMEKSRRPGKIYCFAQNTHTQQEQPFSGTRNIKYQRQHNTFKTMAANEDSMFTLHQIFMYVLHFDTGVKGDRSFIIKNILLQLR